MTEAHRITSLFEKLYNGKPWLDINMVSTLKSIHAKQAQKRVLKNCNTIWEITAHVIAWRQNVLQRVNGEVITTPNHNYIEEVKDTSEAAWENTLRDLDVSQKQWVDFLKTSSDNSLKLIYTPNNMTYYEHIHGIIQHDAYHLGQIMLLKKLLSN